MKLREYLVEKATTDEAFRTRLMADPHAAIKEELDVAVPPGFSIKVHEDGADTSHLVSRRTRSPPCWSGWNGPARRPRRRTSSPAWTTSPPASP